MHWLQRVALLGVGLALVIGLFFRLLSTPASVPNGDRQQESASTAPKPNQGLPSSKSQRLNPALVASSPASGGSSRSGFDSRAKVIEELSRRQTAQTDSPPKGLEAYRHLAMGSARRINERSFRVLGARAVRATDYSPRMGEVLFEKDGFRVVPLAAGVAEEDWQGMQLKDGEFPVVVNSSNGRLGLVTGTLVIKMADLSRAAELASREGLAIVHVDESISTVYLKAPAGYRLLPGMERIRGERGQVERVELEIYESKKVPR